MQNLVYFVFIVSLSVFAQKKVKGVFIDSTKLKVASVFGIDTFETLYYTTKDYTFHKKTKDTTITYTNFQLGEVTTANAFNPLKINLFYKDFNTVVILDNRLAEVSKVDFNVVQPYKNVSFVSTGFDFVGRAFTTVIGFTQAGTKFLFSNMDSNVIESPSCSYKIRRPSSGSAFAIWAFDTRVIFS